MLVGRAPLRISFSGGGTDLEEYHKKYDGYSVSYTIDKYTFVIAKLRANAKRRYPTSCTWRGHR